MSDHATIDDIKVDALFEIAKEGNERELELNIGCEVVVGLIQRMRDAEGERDEARDLHAQVCERYGDAVSHLDRIHLALEAWRNAHPNVGAIDCEFVERGHVAQKTLDPDALPYYGAFAGTIPGAVSE